MALLLSINDRILGICERYQWTQANAPVAELRRDRQDHEETMGAYRARNEERAIELIQMHLDQARAAILRRLDSRGAQIT